MSEHAEDQDQEEYQPPAQDTVNEASGEMIDEGRLKVEASPSSEIAASKAEPSKKDTPTPAEPESASLTPKNKPEQEPEPQSKPEPEHKTSSSKSKTVTPSKKRKVSTSTTPTPTPNKTRRTRANNNNTTTNNTTPKALIHYLLTPSCATLVRSPDEQSHHTSHPDQLTYTTNPPLTPFAELLSALLLSRPISHNLGHRSIRTLLNPPWNYTSPAALLSPKYTPDVRDGKAPDGDAAQTVYKALEEARTQHKAKTASQLVGLAEVCAAEFCEGDEDAALSKLRQMVQDANVGEAGNVFEDAVKSKVKGVGKTGVEIARRRLQGVEGWEGLGPFIDARTKGVLERMGVGGDADEVWELVVGCIGDGDEVDIAGDGGERKLQGESERAKWKAFVTVLERAVEADLAGKVDEVLERAADDGDGK